MRRWILVATLAVLPLLLAASVVVNLLFATDVVGGSGGLDLDAYGAGVAEGFGQCDAGQDPDREVVPLETTVAGVTRIAGTTWLAGTTDFAYGYGVGFTACEFATRGITVGRDEGYDDGYAAGYDKGDLDGYDRGYGEAQVVCEDLLYALNRRGIDFSYDC